MNERKFYSNQAKKKEVFMGEYLELIGEENRNFLLFYSYASLRKAQIFAHGENDFTLRLSKVTPSGVYLDIDVSLTKEELSQSFAKKALDVTNEMMSNKSIIRNNLKEQGVKAADLSKLETAYRIFVAKVKRNCESFIKL